MRTSGMRSAQLQSRTASLGATQPWQYQLLNAWQQLFTNGLEVLWVKRMLRVSFPVLQLIDLLCGVPPCAKHGLLEHTACTLGHGCLKLA
jgi:hypothetical protein